MHLEYNENELTKAHLDDLHCTLLQLLQIVLKNEELPEVGEGICANWATLLNPVVPRSLWTLPFNYCSEFCIDWPGYQVGRNRSWPITHNPDFSTWEGTNREQRISLMRYLLKRLRDHKRRAV